MKGNIINEEVSKHLKSNEGKWFRLSALVRYNSVDDSFDFFGTQLEKREGESNE